ncbi:putative multidrug resistance protein fnx1 [Xylariaceae sp. FL0255]|nr:putative multidrug resistance protein fnx1 [Xylariaceae sp. FL0255]
MATYNTHEAQTSDPNEQETWKEGEALQLELESIKRSSGTSEGEPEIVYFEGLRLSLICTAIAIMMFLVNLKVPVVITALVVSAYLLGYFGVIVINAKFSDIFSRKIVLLASIVVFIIFSAACAAAQTIIQLIVFRGFQGVGGGGCWSLATIFVTELVPLEKYPTFVANVSIVNALALLLGPIIGGAIASHTTWRWIFIIKSESLIPVTACTSPDLETIIPIAIPALVLAFLFIPRDFPYHGHHERDPHPRTRLLTNLAVWERHVTLSNSDSIREPILPWRFLLNRQIMGILLNFALLGGPTVIGMLILPQRYQLVYGLSGLDAGVRLIPFTATIPIGSIFASIMSGKHKVPPVYLLLLGSGLQILGFALIGTLPSTLTVPSRVYGFQVLAGWGCGINFSLLFNLIPIIVERRDIAVGLGAGSQFRFMGGAVVLAIATALFNSYTNARLDAQIGFSDTNALIQVLPTLAQSVQDNVRRILATGFSHQVLVLAVSAALQVPATLLMWQKKQNTL